MNKLLKFCDKCDEAFAERFSFCPNCGGELQSYEINPLKAQAAEPVATPAILAAEGAKNAEVSEIPEFETAKSGGDARVYSLESEAGEAPAAAAPVFASAAMHEVAPAGKNGWREVKSTSLVPADDGLYHLTMVPSRTILNDPLFRTTGIAALVAVLTLCIGFIVRDLFTQYVNVSSPDTYDLVGAVYISDEITDVEDIKLQEDKQKGGGGGGGGRNDPTPASEGRLAPQFKTPPLLTPSQEDIRVSDPVLKVWRSTQGPQEVIPENNGKPLGVGLNKIQGFDGPGGGLGQGGGDGTGQGPGRGPGAGPGEGGGIGAGCCGGYGPGGGPGSGGDDAPPPPPRGPSKPVRITYQQKPNYTEEARKAQINGTVRLRVTFNANGTIGGITPVGSLGYGLTEQAISAARNLRFEPAMKNGVPVTSSKVVEFNFNIY